MLNFMRLAILLVCGLPLLAQDAVNRAWQILDRGLHDGNPAKRVQAVVAMGILRPQGKAVETVESAFQDKDYSVRQAACVSLDQMKSHQSIHKLRDALNDPAPEVIFAAAKALYDIGDPTGREVMVAVILGDQADASGFFSSSMHNIKTKMHDPKGLVMIGLKEGAGAFLGPASLGIPVAEGLLKDANASGKTVAEAMLANDRHLEVVEAMHQGLQDKNWTVRAAAARALALGSHKEMFDDIALLLDDKKEEAQYSAAAAVIRLRQPVETRAVPQKAAK